METKKILIVIDMQNDFIDGSLGTKEAQAIVPKVCEKIKNWDGEVIFTRDTHYEDYLKTQEGINLPVEHCIVGTNGWLINDYVMSSYLDTFDEKHNQNLNIINKDTFNSKNLVCFDFSEFVRTLNIRINIKSYTVNFLHSIPRKGMF